jgi:hypothetical protein
MKKIQYFFDELQYMFIFDIALRTKVHVEDDSDVQVVITVK